ncbi:VCBS repeat-containing protein [Dyadobacter tibetensis]|uniref:VCBS repeat-containing protein n=1 Tax=Dyadobacter tibetensis TaxID=1211851 RepID=UPI000471EC8D|nr:VCBS repeat-containing protein [Dyadobacter tibetensis]
MNYWPSKSLNGYPAAIIWILSLTGLLLTFSNCKPKADATPDLFRLLPASSTGIDFSNRLTSSKSFNIFYYMYFYNGAGIGAADFNNDGLVDLFFSANQEPSRMYLNKGSLKFEDITDKANLSEGKAWSTGVSVIDINQDGLMDIYISQVGDFESMKGHNLLYVCERINSEGIPIYREKSKEYGLDLVVFGTQALFFDYDLDGDLDMFQLNHSVHQNGTFGRRDQFLKTFHPMAGDRLFENKNQKFVDVTPKAGIHSNALGYGLGLGVGDVNLDGYPDLYIGNDFHENDYLYINQKNGRFKDESDRAFGHTSQFSMGVDIADLDNDLFPEIISLDMLPDDYEILKKSEGEDSYSISRYKLEQGYSRQYARNNLQRNNGNGTYSEVGTYAGIHASDWSWASLFTDFDNDGLKDLFISNGIPKRMNDIDYIKYVSNDVVQQKINDRNFDENDPGLADKLPEIKLKNKFFRNLGDLSFEDVELKIDGNQISYSNGAVYADLDNDGDLDLVTNNINDPVFVYENLANEQSSPNDYLRIYLQGAKGNRNAIGAKIVVYKKENAVLLYEKFPVRGFLSSMEIPVHIGLGKKQEVDSVMCVWPDHRYQMIYSDGLNDSISISYNSQLPILDYDQLRPELNQSVSHPTYKDIAGKLGLHATHKENNFVEFDRNSLIPFETTADGPALAVGDFNKDGLEDVFLGSSKKTQSRLFIQNSLGQFEESFQAALRQDSTYEEIDAQWLDANGDGYLDLVVATGGNEFFNRSEYQQPRLYLNDRRGGLAVKDNAFENIYVTASCVKVCDFTGDGKPDLFIGGRSEPLNYGDRPKSYLLANNGDGTFSDVTEQYAKTLKSIGFVRDAEWVDMNSDGNKDLVVALEWDGIYVFTNQKKSFVPSQLTDKKGWWNFIYPVDLDGDGDMDLLSGNLGLNSRLKASKEQPLRVYVNDYDNNGRAEPILTYYLNGVESLFPTKMELEKQIPFIRKKYSRASKFAQANFREILGPDKIKEAEVREANYFESSVFINNGRGSFQCIALPFKGQWSPLYAAAALEGKKGDLPDLMVMGNFFDSNIQMGRYDANYGSILRNRGGGHFEVEPIPGLVINGQVKKIRSIMVGGKRLFLIARNNGNLMAIESE